MSCRIHPPSCSSNSIWQDIQRINLSTGTERVGSCFASYIQCEHTLSSSRRNSCEKKHIALKADKSKCRGLGQRFNTPCVRNEGVSEHVALLLFYSLTLPAEASGIHSTRIHDVDNTQVLPRLSWLSDCLRISPA